MSDLFATFPAVKKILNDFFNSQRGSGRTYLLKQRVTEDSIVVTTKGAASQYDDLRTVGVPVISLEPTKEAVWQFFRARKGMDPKTIYFTEEWLTTYIMQGVRDLENVITHGASARNQRLPEPHHLFLARYNLNP